MPKKPFIYRQDRRAAYRNLEPTAIHPSNVSIGNLTNTNISLVTFTLPNGSKALLTSTVSIGTNQRIGTVPYMIAMFEGSATTANQIPFGSSIATSDYDVIGPHAMPQLSPIGTDGYNVVYKTVIANNTGSQETILVYVQARIIKSIGGGSDGGQAGSII